VARPNTRDNAEEDLDIERSVKCVRIQPDADLEKNLANNVAVLKLSQNDEIITTSLTNAERGVASVIDLKSAADRPADRPQGVKGSSKNNRESFLDLRIGLVPHNEGLGEELKSVKRPTRQTSRNGIFLYQHGMSSSK
jgi:hypothetical protein